MADAAAALVARLTADLAEYKKKMKEAGKDAEDTVADIEDKFKKANPAFSGKLLLAGGLLGAVGAAVLLVEKLFAANHEMAKLHDQAKLLSLSVEKLQEFQFGARTVGISDKDFTKDLENLGRLLNDAQRNENSLTRLFEANNIKLKDREGHMISIEQAMLRLADLTKRAGTEFDKIEIAKRGGFSAESVQLLEKGADAILRLGVEARTTGTVISAEIIDRAKKFDEEWTKATANWGRGLKSLLAEILPTIDMLISKSLELLANLSKAASKQTIASTLESGGGLEALNLEQLEELLRIIERTKGSAQEIKKLSEEFRGTSWGKLLLSLYDPDAIKQAEQGAITAEQVQARIEALLERMRESRGRFPRGPQAQDPADKDSPTVIPSKPFSNENAFTREEAAIVKRIALMQAETATIGLGTEARARAKAETELLQAAEKAGIPITEQLRITIGSLADAYGQVSIRLEKAKQDFEKFVELQNFFGNQMISGIMGMVSGTEKLSDSMKRLANSIAQAALQALLLGQGPLSGLLGTTAPKGTGMGGLLGLLFKSFSGTFATGGYIPAGKWGVTGERGPEITYGGRNGVTVAPISSSRGGGLTVMVSSNPVFQAGMTPTDMAQIRAMMAQNNRVLSGEIVSGIRSGNRNDPGALYR